MEIIESVEKLKIISVNNPNFKYELETLRAYKPKGESYVIIELRHTKDNLINVDGVICKPKKIEVWPSGRCRLWYSEPKGKSFSQISWPIEIKFIKS